MRALICTCLLLIPFAAVLAQETGQAQAKKIEITYSLSGPEMYRTWCAPCHGVDGKGNGPAAAALKKSPADLTLLSKKNGGKFPTGRVRNYIEGQDESTTAHGSREMPIWGDVFRSIGNDQGAITYRLVTLSTYLESLQAK
jgi:mono/diheme cytochrome c family protein